MGYIRGILISILSKIVFYLLQDGCIRIRMRILTYTSDLHLHHRHLPVH